MFNNDFYKSYIVNLRQTYRPTKGFPFKFFLKKIFSFSYNLHENVFHNLTNLSSVFPTFNLVLKYTKKYLIS